VNIVKFDDTHKTFFLFGRIYQWVKDYAEANNMSNSVLGQRIAVLLHDAAGGEVLGAENSLPSLFQESEVDEEIVEEAEAEIPQPISKAGGRRVDRPRCLQCGIDFPNKQAKARHYYQVHKKPAEAKARKLAKKQTRKVSAQRLASLRDRAAMARAAKAAKRAQTMPQQLPQQVRNAMAQYNEAVAQEPVNGVATGA